MDLLSLLYQNLGGAKCRPCTSLKPKKNVTDFGDWTPFLDPLEVVPRFSCLVPSGPACDRPGAGPRAKRTARRWWRMGRWWGTGPKWDISGGLAELVGCNLSQKHRALQIWVGEVGNTGGWCYYHFFDLHFRVMQPHAVDPRTWDVGFSQLYPKSLFHSDWLMISAVFGHSQSWMKSAGTAYTSALWHQSTIVSPGLSKLNQSNDPRTEASAPSGCTWDRALWPLECWKEHPVEWNPGRLSWGMAQKWFEDVEGFWTLFFRCDLVGMNWCKVPCSTYPLEQMTVPPGANGLKKAAPTSVKGGRTRTLNWYPIGFDEPIGSLDTLRLFFFTLFWWLHRKIKRWMRWKSNRGWAGNGVRLGAGSGDDKKSELTRHGQGPALEPPEMLVTKMRAREGLHVYPTLGGIHAYIHICIYIYT